jgi:1,4-dihydroxy-2-naphthoyl-CoA hydrolase
MIWKHEADPDSLNAMAKDTMLEHLGITFSATGDDFIEATMPVDARTVQPFGVLHGGASVTLAESLGSVAAHLCVDDPSTHAAVGVEINASHLRSVPHGQFVTGRATPIRVGRRIQVWNIDIRDGDKRLICTSRITVAIVERSG